LRQVLGDHKQGWGLKARRYGLADVNISRHNEVGITFRVVSLGGFPPFSHAELAVFLSELPIAYRYSIRAIPLPIRTAIGQIGVHRRNWFQKRKGARAIISETIGSGTAAAFENQHALKMAADADDAIAEAEAGDVRFCYATPRVVINARSAAEADEAARLIFKVCQNMGFDPRIETINNVEAWLGSVPIHGWYDMRKPLVSTRNLADIMPLTSIWPGMAINPSPYYPKNTPALCYGARLAAHRGVSTSTSLIPATPLGLARPEWVKAWRWP
jgi:type IV secretion system protein VirB4